VAEQASGHHSMSSEISFKITHTFYEDETTPTQNAMKGKKYYEVSEMLQKLSGVG
jgi:3-methyladenine DNA glycosylase/8-oxoguanine DNA glycosylase